MILSHAHSLQVNDIHVMLHRGLGRISTECLDHLYRKQGVKTEGEVHLLTHPLEYFSCDIQSQWPIAQFGKAPRYILKNLPILLY
jgi:hypothetical protein